VEETDRQTHRQTHKPTEPQHGAPKNNTHLLVLTEDR